ncbi:ligand-binding sensor domain-containing protein [Thermophagus xiamenensis]|uniref:Serine phosphatase RsbU, regulator of sigma subunit n=2 Tax=Thermophagus xiamenensis TaxID=385682 RepID=A0A1I1UKM8_9BACT|nr:two-component regulator propeller domain-containing protein [Thermophagus xiamenensis]SFD71319.1 Serine phosphatase RsbU, regulator of sigma subunit [Thermophagus xiamenensis]
MGTRPNKLTLLIVVLFYIHSYFLKAQSFRFQTFDSSVGLPQNFVYALEQDQNGYIWMGTGEGLVKYNGLEFKNYNQTDSLADDFITSLHISYKGTLWIGHNNGDITLYQNNRFIPIRISETQSPVTAIKTLNKETILFACQNEGLIQLNTNTLEYKLLNNELLKQKLIYSLGVRNKILLVGTSEGLYRITLSQKNTVVSTTKISEIPSTKINCINPRKGIIDDYWIGTEDSGFYLYSERGDETRHIVDNSFCLKFDIQWENIKDIEEEPNGNLLLATWGNGVIKLFFDPDAQKYVDSYNFSIENGLNNNYTRAILCDRESNYWIATYGGGTTLLTNQYYVFYHLETIGFEKNKSFSLFRHDSTLWLGLDKGLIKTDPYCLTNFEYYDAELGIPYDEITGLYQTDEGTVFAASGNKGLFYRNKNELKFRRWVYSNNQLCLKIRDIKGHGDNVYLATYGGLFIINTKTRQIEHLTTERGLPHNSINFVYIDNHNNLWIGPKNSGICQIKDARIEMHKISDSPVDVYGMTQTSDGSIWLATRGQGVIHYANDSIHHFTVNNGLAKNFCYSISSDKNDRIWVAHHPGLSMINSNTGQVEIYGHNQGVGYDFYQIWKDSDETLWFVGDQGAIHYFPNKHKKNLIPPALNFTQISISGKNYNPGTPINLPYPYRKNYQLRFKFIGISFKNQDQVTYQYQLLRSTDEETSDWIDLGKTNFREYDFLPNGNYTLKVRACNADGVVSDPISLSFSIAAPFWKKPWFYLAFIALLTYTVYLIIISREKKLKRQKEQLQRAVDIQTIRLREQKALIEKKNRDITDSINYAKTIQSSILPPISVLKSYYPESFVFFQPRDIVSGDFYWFHKAKNHFILTCADCTGHGVPGAFMSMIGSTLLNDIVKRENVNSPAALLERLDLEIKVLLQNSKNKENTHDGMDISVIDIEMTTNKVRVASAKRPVYLYLNNELVIYKGNRRSIGDSLVDGDTPFVNMEYQCHPNDIIYLFSDGFSDQFGGPKEKKFMKVGIQKMLKEIHHLPMDEQYKAVQKYFHEWKGDLEQVDDVIFMGIKLQ